MQIIFLIFTINLKNIRNNRDLKQGFEAYLTVGIVPIHSDNE